MRQVNISEAVNSKFYPSLNGFRGVSILIVVLSHLSLSSNRIYTTVFNGVLGVNIFFVLSGFLITTLCIKEKELTGTLSLKGFYWRRVLRIFPVAYLYIFVLLLLNIIYALRIPISQFFVAGFYLMDFNYFKKHDFTYLVAHYWSLSVEEQFYILFPFVLKINRKIFSYIILFIVFALPLLCSLQEVCEPLNKGIFYAFTHYVIKFQAIAVGCMFSLLAFDKFLDKPWLVSTKIIGNIAAFFLLFYLGYDLSYSIKAVYINLIISLLTGYLIVSNLITSNDWIFKLLNLKALSFIGILSYSIYIWQQMFTSYDARLPKWFSASPYNLVGLIIVPLLSYYLYEKYFLKLKSKGRSKSFIKQPTMV